MTDLSTALSDGACLVHSSGPQSDLRAVLVTRLSRYYTRLGSEPPSFDSYPLEAIQSRTAQEALAVVARVQQILQQDAPPSPTGQPDPSPSLGTRDLAEIRTLLSIVFNWGVKHLLDKLIIALHTTNSVQERSPVDLTTAPEDYRLLKGLVLDILSLLFPWGVADKIAQTLVTTVVLDRHAADLLKSCLTLGWLPSSLSFEGMQTLDVARPFTSRILNFLSPTQAITSLGTIISHTPFLPHVRKLCASFLSQQLLRPQGVRGFCAAMFGESAALNEDAPMEKLDHIARVLTTIPANTKPQEYFSSVIPRVIDMLSPPDTSANKRAASYTLSRILSTDKPFTHQELAIEIAFSILHRPFLVLSEDANLEEGSPDLLRPDPSVVLPRLITLVSNADPSPSLISAILSPIATSLYSLLHCMDQVKTSDPTLTHSLRGLLITWGKIVNPSDGVDILWHLVEDEAESWKIEPNGFHRSRDFEQKSRLSLLTPQDLRAEETELNANILDLYPDPNHFVALLKDIDRPEISSDLFLKLLEAFFRQKARRSKGDPVKTLLYLQLIMQMQTNMSHGKPSSNILHKPAHLLSFIKHVLDRICHPNNEGRHDLDWDNISDEADSDDDTPGATIITADEEMAETSLNLLLSILEANEDLSARTEPILNDIFSLLEPLTRLGSSSIAPLARETRMVITARLASTSSAPGSNTRGREESHQVIYQKALKLLQDPILPVRAHGLLLLRQLVTPTSSDVSESSKIDTALVPAILDIFLQSIQDDDSYIFSNAVQGLAAMVDAFGKDVLKSLVKEYADGLERLGATSLTQRELDVRVRVGEALASAIRRCGAALGMYVDILVPPLFYILRSRNVPIILRMSSISLLTECEETSPLAMLPFVTDLVNTMTDLLQIETVPSKSRNSALEKDLKTTEIPDVDAEPTSKVPKVPAFRRAAAQFLLLVVRQTIKRVYESTFETSPVPIGLLKRAKITLSYVASTDEDSIFRKIAGEASEELGQLQEALLGMSAR